MTPTHTERRSLSDILGDLRKPLPGRVIKQRKQGGQSLDYIEWFTAVRVLDHFAPGWEGHVVRIEELANSVLVVYRITLHGSDYSASREATGNEPNESKAYGDAFSNAEAMAFKRAAAKFGVALHLYEK